MMDESKQSAAHLYPMRPLEARRVALFVSELPFLYPMRPLEARRRAQFHTQLVCHLYPMRLGL